MVELIPLLHDTNIIPIVMIISSMVLRHLSTAYGCYCFTVFYLRLFLLSTCCERLPLFDGGMVFYVALIISYLTDRYLPIDYHVVLHNALTHMIRKRFCHLLKRSPALFLAFIATYNKFILLCAFDELLSVLFNDCP